MLSAISYPLSAIRISLIANRHPLTAYRLPLTTMPSLSPAQLSLLRHAAQVPLDAAVWSVEGPAAVACLQGIVTADVERAGPGSVRYAGFLTPKGMLISDAWLLRMGDGFRVVAPAAARELLAALFPRMMPPRLARATPTDDSVTAVVGAGAGTLLDEQGAPAPGTVEMRDGTWVARPAGGGPFDLLHLAATGTPMPHTAYMIGTPRPPVCRMRLKATLGEPTNSDSVSHQLLKLCRRTSQGKPVRGPYCTAPP